LNILYCVITPHVLAEVSNLAEKQPMNFGDFIKSCVKAMEGIDEVYISKEKILDTKEVLKFGVADTSLLEQITALRNMFFEF